MSQFLAPKHPGHFQFDPAWSRYSVDVATGFHTPRLVALLDTIGWSDNWTCRFRLPRFDITGGRVVIERPDFLAVPAQPAANLEPPISLTVRDAKILSTSCWETSLFWAIFAGILHNIVAPISRFPPLGMALIGPTAIAFGREIATMFGCTKFDIEPDKRFPFLLRQWERGAGRHAWPALVVPPPGRPGVVRRWLQSGPRNGILLVPDDYAGYGDKLDGWYAVRAEQRIGLSPALREIGLRLLPAYLLDLSRRYYGLSTYTPGLLHGVLMDLEDWIRRCGGRGQGVMGARRFLPAAEVSYSASGRRAIKAG